MKTIRSISAVAIIFFLIISSNSSFANNSDFKTMEGVKVFIDGAEFKTQQAIYTYKDTTMIPMRALFEKVGATVDWKPSTNSIIASTDKTFIELSINCKTVKVNGKDLVLRVEPKVFNEVTYVPLRFIAEALNYDVDWDNENRSISIIDIEEIGEIKHSKVYESSSSFKTDSLKMEIINNDSISVKGVTGLNKTNWLFSLEGDSEFSEFMNINCDNTYEKTFKLKNILKEGEYKIGVYLKDSCETRYQGYYWNIPLKYENGELFFPVANIYVNNYLQFIKGSSVDPKDYLTSTIENKSERKKVEDLAKEITKDAKSDYEKVLKINNWVSENIYYNWDGYKTGNYGSTDAYGTLEDRKSVCQGYAELTNELLRLSGVPSKLVVGHALGVSASDRYWDSVDHTKSNHAWNEAYADNRWITLDTTWNSKNNYEDGKFNKGNINYRYFDPNLQAFSYTHKIINNK